MHPGEMGRYMPGCLENFNPAYEIIFHCMKDYGRCPETVGSKAAFQLWRKAMDSEISSLTLRALRRVLRATEIGSRQLAATTGLTPSQMLVLREIDVRGLTTPSTIAHAVQFSQATITAIVDRLVALGFVQRQRSETDKRQFRLSLLPEGVRALAEAPDPLQKRFTDRFDALPAWERAMILAATERLAMLMDAQSIDAAPLLDGGRIDRIEPD